MYINSLKQKLNCTNAYNESFSFEKTVVNNHLNDLPHKFAVNIKED